MEAIKRDNLKGNRQKKQDNELGTIEAIAGELTSAKLKQAVIMAEIIGKPLSKRKGRRNR